MSRVIYKLVNGIASDVQRLRDDKPTPAGYLETTPDKPHTPKDLSDPQAWAAREAKEKESLSVDDVVALLKTKGVIDDLDIEKAQKSRRG